MKTFLKKCQLFGNFDFWFWKKFIDFEKFNLKMLDIKIEAQKLSSFSWKSFKIWIARPLKATAQWSDHCARRKRHFVDNYKAAIIFILQKVIVVDLSNVCFMCFATMTLSIAITVKH